MFTSFIGKSIHLNAHKIKAKKSSGTMANCKSLLPCPRTLKKREALGIPFPTLLHHGSPLPVDTVTELEQQH